MSLAALSCLGAIAVELSPGTSAQHVVLERDAAGALAELAARDLARFAPAVAQLDLVLAAALFDPVELLRPRWPLHAELERWCAQAPGAGARVIGFGADDGLLPAALQPSPAYASGPLRLLPWLVRGDSATVSAVGTQLEEGLLEAGMAGAETALLIQQSFQAPVEHARYLTLHDLAALIAMQYEHAGLTALWPLIETALLAPEHEAWLDAAPEPLARYAHGEVRMALLDLDAWVETGFAPFGTDADRLSRAFDRFQMRQRQIAALLEAHGLPVTFKHCPAGADPRAVLSE